MTRQTNTLAPERQAIRSQRNHPTRQRLLLAGIALFQGQGYHGTGVAAILAAARAPKGCFYHHYPGGKEELAIEAVRWLAGEVDHFLDTRLEEGAHGPAMVVGMAEYYAKGLALRRHLWRGSLITVLGAEAVPGAAAIGEALRAAIEGWRQRLAIGFERAGHDAPAEAAQTSLALIEGATLLARISGRPGDLVDIVKHGLSAGGNSRRIENLAR